ncbi:SH3 domain-binding protein 4-like [Branchiostoma lanceolatum]|uniref:SH3 domain-binding protein 4-like n=1 Tax=Branchiostoma lanceolatum TaxID=7740 RepID=UPI003452F1B5
MTTNSSASGDRESPVLSPREAGQPFTYTPADRPKKRSSKGGKKGKREENDQPPCQPEVVTEEVGSDGGVIETTCKDVVVYVPRNHLSGRGVQEVTVTVSTDCPPEAQGPQTAAVAPLVKVELSKPENVEKTIVVDVQMDTRIKEEERNTTHIECLRSSCPNNGYEQVDRQLYRMMPGNIIRLLLQGPGQENFIMVVAKTVKDYIWDTLERKVTFAVFGPWSLQKSMVPVLFYSCHGLRGLLAWYDSLRERMGSASQAEGHVQWGESYDIYVGKPQRLEVTASLKSSSWEVDEENKQTVITKGALKKRRSDKYGFVVTKKSGKKTDPFVITFKVKQEEKSKAFEFHVATPAGPPDSAPTSPRLKRRRRGTPQRRSSANLHPTAPSVINCQIVRAKLTRHRSQWYKLDYNQGQFIPVLTNQGVFGHSDKEEKEYWVGYTDGRVGFFPSDDVEIVESLRPEVCPTKDGLLRSLLEPCRHLKFNYSFIRQEIVNNLVKWPKLARQVGFNEADIEDIKVRNCDDGKEQVAAMMEDLRQRIGEEKPELLMTVIDGLFRCGIPYKKVDCPQLALKIMLDSLLYTVALSTHPSYLELGAKLGYNIIHLMRINQQCKGVSSSEKACQPEYAVLQEWQAQKWSGKNQDPVDMLQWLHIVVQEMSEGSHGDQEFRHIQGVILFLLCYRRIPL